MKLTIKRSEWARGWERDNFLYEDAGGDGQPVLPRRCCIGFLGNACGIPDSELDGYVSPSEFKFATDARWPEWIMRRTDEGHLNPEDELVQYNDGRSISEQEREAKITELMGQYGVEVEFVP